MWLAWRAVTSSSIVAYGSLRAPRLGFWNGIKSSRRKIQTFKRLTKGAFATSDHGVIIGNGRNQNASIGRLGSRRGNRWTCCGNAYRDRMGGSRTSWHGSWEPFCGRSDWGCGKPSGRWCDQSRGGYRNKIKEEIKIRLLRSGGLISKWEGRLIKNDVTRDDDAGYGKIKTTISFVMSGIAKKHTTHRPWSECVCGGGE